MNKVEADLIEHKMTPEVMKAQLEGKCAIYI